MSNLETALSAGDRKTHDMNGWRARHNDALRAFDTDRLPAYSAERAILSAASAIIEWFDTHGGDGYGNPYVLVPMVQAFRAALNFDLGRLDGGTLDSWACKVLQLADVDPDTYEAVTA